MGSRIQCVDKAQNVSFRASAHTGVGIRFPVKMSVNIRLSGNTDCHTSDIGHWFAMTETDFVDSRISFPLSIRLMLFGSKPAVPTLL